MRRPVKGSCGACGRTMWAVMESDAFVDFKLRHCEFDDTWRPTIGHRFTTSDVYVTAVSVFGYDNIVLSDGRRMSFGQYRQLAVDDLRKAGYQ